MTSKRLVRTTFPADHNDLLTPRCRCAHGREPAVPYTNWLDTPAMPPGRRGHARLHPSQEDLLLESADRSHSSRPMAERSVDGRSTGATRGDAPRLTVVIPTRDEAANVRPLLDRLW